MRKWQWYSEGKSEILLINGTNSWFHSQSGGQHGLKKACMSLETLLCLPMWFPFVHNKQDTIITFYRLKYFGKTVRLSLKMWSSIFNLFLFTIRTIWECKCPILVWILNTLTTFDCARVKKTISQSVNRSKVDYFSVLCATFNKKQLWTISEADSL